nr:UBX domain-containing protein 1-like isoform X2 [Ziziphus jujuba var. spinosa]
MVVPEVDKKLLEELEGMGFPTARATRPLHYSGNSSLEAAENWVVEHESDTDIDEMPMVWYQQVQKLRLRSLLLLQKK